ncbi:MAG: HNH endonuclease, partial [Mycobacterium sp.]
MTRRSPKLCAELGCAELVDSGTRRCAQHERERAWRGVDSKRSGTAEHKARRLRVLKRDGYQCQLRYAGTCVGSATDCDHIIPLSEGGTDNDDNCCAACRPCHQRKSSHEGHRAA